MAELLTAQFSDQEEDTQKDKFLTFKLGNESYGMEIKCVTEIIGLQPVTEVPELPGYIKGIINLRGKIIPVMDVRLRFKMPPIEYTDRTCIIVIDVKEISIGLIVDNVADVISIEASQIVDPPEISNVGSRYIKGIGKVGSEVKLILDCDKLISSQEADDLANIN